MKLFLQKTDSEFYTGPKTKAPFMIYAQAKDEAVYVELDNEEGVPGALVKAGVNLHKMLDPDYKSPHLVPPDVIR